MQRVELTLAASGLVWLALATLWIGASSDSQRELSIAGGPACPAAPVRVLEPQYPIGSLVVFHGLGANRLVMLPLGRRFANAGFRVFLVDLPGHGRDSAPFSFAVSESCARGLLASLEHSGQISPIRTVLLGHSMGGALVVRLAGAFKSAGTISIATAPLVRPNHLPGNLLLVAPQLDMPPVLATEQKLAAEEGSERDSAEDFAQDRAFRLLRIAWQTHTSPIFSPAAAADMVHWALDSVRASETPGHSAPQQETTSRVGLLLPIQIWIESPLRIFHAALLGLAGILLMLPAALVLCLKIFRLHVLPDVSKGARPGIALLAWCAVGILSTLLLRFWMPMARLQLYGGDYLASFLLLSGLILAIGFGYASPVNRLPAGSEFSAVIAAALWAMGSVCAVALWMNWQLAELWPISARWTRLPILFVALFPAGVAEECAVGAAAPLGSSRGAARLLLCLGLRAILWGSMLFAFWCGASDALLPVIFLLPLAGLSLGQRLGADVLRLRTGSVLAAAVFDAILGAWFLAAAFPLA